MDNYHNMDSPTVNTSFDSISTTTTDSFSTTDSNGLRITNLDYSITHTQTELDYPMPTRRRRSKERRNPSHKRQISSLSRFAAARTQSQLSPPLTPKVSRDETADLPEQDHEPTFHNYLRAFYHFHPSSTVTSNTEESSITVPINQGDVILVHSIHANGWADGTLLESGARGWLPTNYCEVYDPPSMRNLMNALMHLWDLVRNNEDESLNAFTRQDYVRAMIAGVRSFLERTGCLSRESPLIVSHVALRRLRKHLLGDLSSMVRIAKEIQSTLQNQEGTQGVYSLLDELVLKAFKVATRSVRFLDIWSQDVGTGTRLEFADQQGRLPTPPLELTHSQQGLDATAGPASFEEQGDESDYSRAEQGTQETASNPKNADPFSATVITISPMSPTSDNLQAAVVALAPEQTCDESKNRDEEAAVEPNTTAGSEQVGKQSPQKMRSSLITQMSPPARLSSLAGRNPVLNAGSAGAVQMGVSSPNSGAAPASVSSPFVAPASASASAISDASAASFIVQQQRPASSQFSPTYPQKRFSLSHRLSYAGKAGNLNRQNLASEKLNVAHDTFLSLLSSFIGIHFRSRSREELSNTTTQSIAACRQLLAVVEEVWYRDGCRSEPLRAARDVMYTRLGDLVMAAKAVLAPFTNGEEVLDLESTQMLVGTTTQCIRAAGDCVGRTRNVIERIGDFEFELSNTVSLSDDVFNTIGSQNISELEICPRNDTTVESSHPQSESSGDDVHELNAGTPDAVAPVEVPPEPMARPPPPPALNTENKPLPQPPIETSPISSQDDTAKILTSPLFDSPEPQSIRSSGSSIQQLPRMSIPITHLPLVQELPAHDVISPNTSFDSSANYYNPRSARADSSVADANSTWTAGHPFGHSSTASLASTRATTPDRSPVVREFDPSSLMGSFSSISELQAMAQEQENFEEQVLEKTYAHELIYNKDGQVSGGSLPALVEQLTTHDTTPDATFVTTFYLTFRLFTSAPELARCLIDRFNYVGNSRTVGLPVRLRIYNVFKGWLETHWQHETDVEAIPLIKQFAEETLQTSMPTTTPAKRILDLINIQMEPKQLSAINVVVPRLASTISRNASSISLFSDGQYTQPNVTKSQLNALRQFKAGGPTCSILDFDPMELARQFTIIGSRIFCKIGPEELLALEWQKVKTKAVNVKAMSALSTDLTNLVADTILSLEEPKKRAIIIKQWIKISMKLLELHNYDSLMAIFCCLDSSMIQRLNKTWALVSQKTMLRFKELKAAVDIGRNYAVLRQRLQNHVAPCIPFLGIYLTDLTFVDVGNNTNRQLPDDGSGQRRSVINFDKHMKIAKIIGQVQRFQVPYRLTPVQELQDWMDSQIQRMRNSEEANVMDQYRRSQLLEPRVDQQAAPMPPPVLRRQESTLSIAKMDSNTSDHAHKNKESMSGMSANEKLKMWAAQNLHIGVNSSHHEHQSGGISIL